jgi:hypothetical protein
MLADLWVVVALGGLLGLLIGSFLNVLIYRLPKMLERQWAVECAEMVGKIPEQPEVFNLMLPRSKCQQCAHQIRWFENIPVVSYLFCAGSVPLWHDHQFAVPIGRTQFRISFCVLRLEMGNYSHRLGMVRVFCGPLGSGAD